MVLIKRTISLAVIISLLLSLVVPASAAGHGCGEAERAEQKRAEAKTSRHAGCHGCTQRETSTAHEATVSRANLTPAFAAVDYADCCPASPTESFCCHDGKQEQGRRIDNAPAPAGRAWAPVMLLPALEYLSVSVDGLLRNPAEDQPEPDSSPPFLADITRHTYLKISVLLI